jgi:hypothetical protein
MRCGLCRVVVRFRGMIKRIFVFAVALTLSSAALLWADENVREVQTKLRDGGFYSGEIDGAYSSALAAALTRYQIRNGLAVTGQLDVDTSKALGAKPAVTTSATDAEQDSETWRQLRKSRRQQTSQSPTETKATSDSNGATTENESKPVQKKSVTGTLVSIEGSQDNSGTASPRNISPAGPAAGSQIVAETQAVGPAPSANAGTTTISEAPVAATKTVSRPAADTSSIQVTQVGDSPATNFSADRLRDYVGAFVLAGLDSKGAEADFYADRVRYYNDGIKDRDAIRKDLQRYNARWPHRTFWLPGEIKVQPENDNQVRVTFPLRYELHNGTKQSSGQVEKVLLLQPAGDDFQIVAVNEHGTEH